jgi:hypothetical protein
MNGFERLDEGASSAEPPHFRFTKNINRETIN